MSIVSEWINAQGVDSSKAVVYDLHMEGYKSAQCLTAMRYVSGTGGVLPQLTIAAGALPG